MSSSPEENLAKKAIASHNLKRKMYHNNFVYTKWGDSGSYNLCINSSKLGLNQTVDFLRIILPDGLKSLLFKD